MLKSEELFWTLIRAKHSLNHYDISGRMANGTKSVITCLSALCLWVQIPLQTMHGKYTDGLSQ